MNTVFCATDIVESDDYYNTMCLVPNLLITAY